MRKFWICTALFFAVLLAGCDAAEMSTLPELSKPYSGFYRCEELTLGGRDLLGTFEELTLELGYDGNFELSYRTASGEMGGYSGEYAVSAEGDEIEFRLAKGAHTFRMEKGDILLDYALGGILLHARFALP